MSSFASLNSYIPDGDQVSNAPLTSANEARAIVNSYQKNAREWVPTGNGGAWPFANNATEGNNMASTSSWIKNNPSPISREEEHLHLIANEPRLAVLRIWDEYKTQHSNARLLEEYEHELASHPRTQTNRNFAIGFYSCPQQAGNRIHPFLNAMLWAVITNRTLLWNYYDRESCFHVGKGFGKHVCLAANTEPECSRILDRAPWIPTSQWLNAFQIQLRDDSEPELLSMWSTHAKDLHHRKWEQGDEKHQGLADTTESWVVIFNQMFGTESARALQNKTYREQLLLTDEARERAVSLLSNGPEFVLGLMFRESFAFRDEILPTFLMSGNTYAPTTMTSTLRANTSSSLVSTDHLTFALHSRHQLPEDDGSKIDAEVQCLEKMLAKAPRAQSCHVFLMSDRPKTLEALTVYLQRNHSYCQGVVANHSQGQGLSGEHGPFAGVGFYQDWYMASHARHGLMARASTAFALVWELVEYDRHMEAIRNNVWPPGELAFCKLGKN
jgi:hypothetical protein